MRQHSSVLPPTAWEVVSNRANSKISKTAEPLPQRVYQYFYTYTYRASIPEAKEKISWSMPTYWKGRNLIQFAAAKKHIGLYPGPEAVEAFAGQLTGYKTSKGTIQFPYSKPLPLELIAEIAKWCEAKAEQ